MTSSFAAIVDGSKGTRPGYVYSESDWNPISAAESTQDASKGYRASKTFAERAAWDFMEREKPAFSLSTMNPPLVLGPIHGYLQNLENLNTSNQRFAAMLAGNFKSEIPETGTFVWVDVRDLANAHIRAMESPAAQGKRFFVTAGYFNNAQLVNIVRQNFSELQDRLPPANDMKGGLDPKEGLYKYDNSRSRELLGIQYRSLTESVVDTVKSLLAVGA